MSIKEPGSAPKPLGPWRNWLPTIAIATSRKTRSIMANHKPSEISAGDELHDLVASTAHAVLEAVNERSDALHVVVDSTVEDAVKPVREAEAMARATNVAAGISFTDTVHTALAAAKARPTHPGVR